jgi:hypothetical protein
MDRSCELGRAISHLGAGLYTLERVRVEEVSSGGGRWRLNPRLNGIDPRHQPIPPTSLRGVVDAGACEQLG